MTELLHPALQGFMLGLSFIVAIGAQNAFVLRQGILRQHLFWIALFCSLADAVLIGLSVAGFATLISGSPLLLKLMTYGGAAFLVWYGAAALRRAIKPNALAAAPDSISPLWPVLAKAAAFTFLNPHVYLDALIVGGLSAPFSGIGKLAYGLGQAAASFIWFFALAYGARFLAPLFAKPAAWRVLDGIIAIIMFSIAAGLLLNGVQAK